MKLHIGGKQTKDGWKILNTKPDSGVDFVGDIKDLSQFATESIDEIYASHVLEHVPVGNALDTLRGISRILKKGGRFYVSVPDMDTLCHTFISPLASPKEKYHVMLMIFGGQTDEFDFHHFGWNQIFLTEFLAQAGFAGAERVESFNLFDDTSEYKPYGFSISLNMVATK